MNNKLINKNQNILTFKETDRLKGLLIILVIIGHIEQLFNNTNESFQMLLYSFHVVSFLMLPFLFNKDTLSFHIIKKYLTRIYIPYTIFYIIAVIAFSILSNQFNLFSATVSWIIGTAPLIKSNAGFSVFWFFPALMSTIILILLYNSLSLQLKKLLMYFLLLTHILIPLIPGDILKYFPLGIYIPLYLFSIGMLIKQIYYHSNWKKFTFIFLIVFLILLYLLYGTRFNLASPLLPNIITNPVDFLLHDLLIIVGFFSMILLSKSVDFFLFFGKYSIAIFTIHPFVIQLVNKLYNWSSIFDGIIKLLLVLGLTYLFVKLVYIVKLNRIFYPR